MATLKERLAALEHEVEVLRSWQRQVDTLLHVIVGAAETVIDEDDDTPRATAPEPPS